jgi:hypothetical protein
MFSGTNLIAGDGGFTAFGCDVLAKQPSVLYRFLPLTEALEALSSGMLLWSSPKVLAGPYRSSEDTPLGFDLPTLQRYLVKYLLQLLFAPDDPQGNPGNPIMKAVRRWRNENRFTDDAEATAALGEITRTTVETHYEKISEFYRQWQTTARRQRILSLSSEVSSLHAWDVLADAHQGVALRLAVGEDRLVNTPQKINYRSSPTYITSLREQIKVMLGEEPFPEAG